MLKIEKNRQTPAILHKAESTQHTQPPALTSARHRNAGRGCAVWNHFILGICHHIGGGDRMEGGTGTASSQKGSAQHRHRADTAMQEGKDGIPHRTKHQGWQPSPEQK